MLTISSQQMAALRQVADDRYIEELAAHLQSFAPDLLRTLNPVQLDVALRHGVAQARARGLTQRGPIRFYCDLTVLFGTGFATDPQYPWLSALFAANSSHTEMDRATAVHARTCAWLQAVDGADHLHTRQALVHLDHLCRQGVTFERATLKPRLLSLITLVHPRKVHLTGEPALRQLIDNAVHQGQGIYGFTEARALALVPILRFAFGHQCDHDPLLPWIRHGLDKTAHADPEQRAAALERRALIWLEAALRNYARAC